MDEMTKLSHPLLDKIQYIIRYVGTETDDWVRVKKQFLGVLPPKQRSLFSRRHKTSKKHFLNDFEKELITLWKEMTGVELKIDSDKLHQPSDERPPRYSALMALNEQRKRQKAAHEQK